MAKRRRPTAMPPGPVLAAAIALAGCPEKKREQQAVPPQTAPPPLDAYEPQATPPQVVAVDAGPMIEDVPPQPAPQPTTPQVKPRLPPQPNPHKPPPLVKPGEKKDVSRPVMPTPPQPAREDPPPPPPPPQPPQVVRPGGLEFPRDPPVLVSPFDRTDDD